FWSRGAVVEASGALGAGSPPPQGGRRAAEEAPEAGGEMAMAGEAGLERNRCEITAAIEDGIERLRETLAHDIVMDGAAGQLAEHVAKMKRRQISHIG